MKKVLSILAVMLIIVLMLQACVFAGNGPMPTTEREYNGQKYPVSAYISFWKYENSNWTEKVVYGDETVKNEMPGTFYDKSTNTLTLNNLNEEEVYLETNVMGEDFKIKVVGTNSLQQIDIYGDKYGGSLIIQGNGTLNVNKNKKCSYALGLYAEGSSSILEFGNDVKVNLYSSGNELGGIDSTTVSNNAITFKGNVGSVETQKNGNYYLYTLKGSEFLYKGHPSTVVVELSKKVFTYNKKVQKPSAKIYDGYGTEIESSNYTISYSNEKSKKIGEYSVNITFKDNYAGNQTVTYQIAPKGTKLSKVKANKKAFTATWKKQTKETTGYQVQYSTKKDFSSGVKTINVKKNKITSAVAKKLKAKKKYYVRIRTYKKVGKQKIYSNWSSTKKVTTKK